MRTEIKTFRRPWLHLVKKSTGLFVFLSICVFLEFSLSVTSCSFNLSPECLKMRWANALNFSFLNRNCFQKKDVSSKELLGLCYLTKKCIFSNLLPSLQTVKSKDQMLANMPKIKSISISISHTFAVNSVR